MKSMQSTSSNLNAEDSIVKAKIQLNQSKPFFAYILMHFRFEERNSIASICVSNENRVYYNKGFIESLNNEECEAVLCHEVMHVALQHFARLGGRDKSLFNIATDLVVNNILLANKMRLPSNALKPDANRYNFIGHKGVFTVSDIHKKTAEEVYDELKRNAVKTVAYSAKAIDQHDYKPLHSEAVQQQSKKWGRVLSEAYAYAKSQGREPKGIERAIDSLLQHKMNWKALLQKHIMQLLPYDYTYSRPHKKSASAGFYIPAVKRDTVEVACAIDTSGSISQEELTSFLAEVIGIAKSHDNIKMTILTCDCGINDVYEVSNGSIPKIMSLKIRGGGGTSHVPVFNYFKGRKKPNLLICFTDGFTTCPKESNIKTLWLISKGGIDSEINFGEVIKME